MSAIKDAEALLSSTRHVGALPETEEQKAARRHREWEASLKIDSSVPKLTEADFVRGTPKWRTVESLITEAREAEETRRAREQREREAPELFVVPEPEF